jgi:hypothetical protein
MRSVSRSIPAGTGGARRSVIHALVVFTLTFLLGFTVQAQPPNLNLKRVTVNWPSIELYFSVGCNGNPAYDMKAENFRVQDNGQDIASFTLDCPDPTRRCAISAALVFDGSGSMTGIDLQNAKDAGKAFVDLMDGVADEAAVISFNQQVTTASQTTTLKPLLYTAIDNLPASGQSAAWDGAYTGVEEIIARGSNSCRAVILLMDGFDNSSSHTVQEIIALATRNHIRVFTIGLGGTLPVAELEMLALLTGGRYYQVTNPTQLPMVYREISTIMFQGFQECRITYDAPCGDGALHTVLLTLENFCGAGSDQKAKTYRALIDSSRITALQFDIPDTSGYGRSNITVPIELRSDLDGGELPAMLFTMRGTGSCFTLGGASTPPGSLLEGVPVTVTPVQGGFRVATTMGKKLQDAGTLMYVTLNLGEFPDTACCTLTMEDVQFASGCYRAEIDGGEICVLPRLARLDCTMDVPRTISWNRTRSSYEPDPLPVTMRVYNSGGETGTGGRYRITFDTTKLTLVSPLSTVQSGSPPDIAPGSWAEAIWQLTPKYRTADDSTVINVEATFDNHGSLDCAAKIFIERADTDLRCTLTADQLTVDTLQQQYVPTPFLLSATVSNHGVRQLDNVRAEIMLPPELVLAGADAPANFSKSVTPAQLAPQASGVAAWELGVALPWPVTAQDVPVTVRTTTGNGDTTQCQLMVHIPAMAFPFDFSLQANGPLTFCEGNEVVLDAGDGFISYLWSTLESTRFITVNSSGEYYCRVIDQGGLVGYSDTLQVTVLPAPLPSIRVIGSNPLCKGDTITLDGDPGFVSYLWSTGDTTQSITVTKADIYTLTVVDDDGCRGGSAPVAVQKFPTPQRPLIARSGDVLTSSRAYQYQWLRNHVPIPGATNQFYQVTAIGSYTVRISDSSGCTAESIPLDVSVLDVGELPPAITALDLYPNPASGSATLFLRLRVPGEALIEVHDMLGRRVLQRRRTVDDRGLREVLSLQGLQPGMYFVRVTAGNSHVLRPLLLVRQ